MLRLAAGLVWLAAFAAAAPAWAQVPDDFRIVVSSRPVHLGEPMDEQGVVIDADGSVYAKPFRTYEGGPEFGPYRGSLGADQMAAIVEAVEANGFFDLDEEYADYRIGGGDQATIAVRLNGRTHYVTAINSPLEPFDDIVRAVNRQLPEERRIYYNALVYPWVYDLPQEEQP
ncbi:MAG: hypothetical protein NXI12_10440 [Alphaproteobacteria bacterium]|nr:hypothetical protein [Alphaproteobacteria bacterium]